jgi:uncharacterized membrane protein
MEKMIQAVFNSEVEAFKGLQALQQLAAVKDISLGETYVINKDGNGDTAIRSAKDDDQGAGALGGGLIGGLIGLLAGPLGLIVGVAGGMLAGSAGETLRAESVSDYLDVVSSNIPNGTSVLVAHIWEDWETPVNTVLLPLTEQISRYNLDEQVYVPVQTEMSKLSEDIKTAEQKLVEADETTKAEWTRSLEELRTKREKLKDKLNVNVDHHEKQFQSWIDHHQEELGQDQDRRERLKKRLEDQQMRLAALRKNRSQL